MSEFGCYGTAVHRSRLSTLLIDVPSDQVPGAAHLGITVAGQDDFLSGLLELYPDAVLGALRRPHPVTAVSPGLS